MKNRGGMKAMSDLSPRGLRVLFIPALFLGVSAFFCGESKAVQRSLSTGTQFREWNEVVDPAFLKKLGEFGVKISDLIFSAIHTIDQKIYGSPRISFGLTINRNVFNNHDDKHTWTVMDKIGVGASVPFYSPPAAPIGPMTQLGFFIGSSSGVEFTDIRQVSSERYAQMQSVPETLSELRENSTFQTLTLFHQSRFFAQAKGNVSPSLLSSPFSSASAASGASSSSADPEKGRWIPIQKQGGSSHVLGFLPDEGENYVRYSGLWNLALVPFKLPLTLKAFQRLEDGEIVSYLGQGAVELGASVGWNLDPASLVGIVDAGVSFSAFVRGGYRISVKRESSTLAQVKLTRLITDGSRWTIGGGYTPGLLDSIIIINGLRGLLQIYPVQINLGTQNDRTFEITYEYDLSTEAGKSAYERAVLGSFRVSDELSYNAQGERRRSIEETGVIRVSDELVESTTDQFDENMQLAFLFRMDQGSQVVHAITTLTTPEGTKRTLKAMAQNTKEWRTIFAQYEKTQHNFMIEVDLDACAKDPENCDSFSFQYETRIEDSNLSQKNLLYAWIEMENSLGRVDLIPRTPLVREIKSLRRSGLKPFFLLQEGHDLGPGSFYYRVNLTSAQMKQWVDYPKSQMWQALEKAFHVPTGVWSHFLYRFFYYLTRSPVSLIDIPLNLLQMNLAPGTNLAHAQKIHDQWVGLKEFSTIDTQAQAIARLFSDSIYGKELTQLIRAVFDGNDVPYEFLASNQSFGRLSEEGVTRLHHEDLASERLKSVDFNSEGLSESERDPRLWIHSLAVRQYSSDIRGQYFSAFFSSEPKKIYIDLFSSEWTLGLENWRLVSSKTIENNGMIHEGQGWFPIAPDDLRSPLFGLIGSLKPGVRYLLRMALSEDGVHWGRVSEVPFTL